MNVVEDFLAVMDLDSLESARPVSEIVEQPNEITRKFGRFTYKKGFLLLRMLNKVLGENTFKQGIRNYIKKHMVSNMKPKNLWKALTKEAHRMGSLVEHLTVEQIIGSWTSRVGYPVLRVVWDSSFNKINVSQVLES